MVSVVTPLIGIMTTYGATPDDKVGRSGFSWKDTHTHLRADPRLAPSQWETSLLRNAVSHWLGANLESTLHIFLIISGPILRCLKRGVIGSRGWLILCVLGYIWLGIEHHTSVRRPSLEEIYERDIIPLKPHLGSATNISAPLQHERKTATRNKSITIARDHWSDSARQFWSVNSADRRAFSPVPCRSLLEANSTAAKVAITYTDSHSRKNIDDEVFNEITKDCALFARERGYLMRPGSKLEEDFPIAFSILFHQHLDTVERLLRALYRPQNIYCLHLDGKSQEKIYQAALSLTKCLPNVFLTKREKIVYAGFSRLKADINCMSDVLNKSRSWKYYINLASEEYPLKTNREIVEILGTYNGANDIEGLDKVTITSRFSTKHKEEIDANGKANIINTGVEKDKPPHNITIVRGSAYGIFSRGFVDFIINDQRARDLLNWSRDTYTPDEHYWATLHHLKHNPHLHTPGGYSGKIYCIAHKHIIIFTDTLLTSCRAIIAKFFTQEIAGAGAQYMSTSTSSRTYTVGLYHLTRHNLLCGNHK